MIKRLWVIWVCVLAGVIGSFGSLDDGLVAYYPFDGDAGDYSGNGYDGTPMLGPTYTDGIKGQAVHLQGSGRLGATGQHILLPAIPFNQSGEFSISVWVNQEGESYDGGEAFVFFGDWRDDEWIGIGNFYENDDLWFGAGFRLIPGSQAAYNSWYLLTLVVEDGYLKVYRDGILLGKAPGNPYTELVDGGIGIHWWGDRNGVGTRYIGLIDEVRIYNRALSPSEIALLYSLQTPFAAFQPAMTHVNFGGEDSADHFFYSGTLTLDAVSDGIDLSTDEIVIEAGPFKMEIPAGSLEACGAGHNKWNGTIDDANVKVMLKELGENSYQFSVQAHGVDLSGWTNPADWSLSIGNDIGTETKWLKGHLLDKGN